MIKCFPPIVQSHVHLLKTKVSMAQVAGSRETRVSLRRVTQNERERERERSNESKRTWRVNDHNDMTSALEMCGVF